MSAVVAIIPARGGSRRLPRKNVHPVLGRPMIAWTIDACKRSRHITHVFVSTEDPAIAAVARASGAEVVDRPAELARDEVFKMDAVADAAARIARKGVAADIVLSVQANSPELTSEMLDAAIDRLRERDLWEVFSVDPDLVQNGAFRVMRASVVSHRTLSAHCAVMIADVIDVHTAEDVARVEARLRARAEGSRVPHL